MFTPHRQILAEAGRAFSAAFDPEVAPWNVVRFFVPRMADWAVVGQVADDGSVTRVAHAHVDPMLAQQLAGVDRIVPAGHGAEYLDAVARVFRTGRPFAVADASDRPALLPPGLRVPDTRSLLVVPFRPRRQRPSGVIILGAHDAGRYRPAEARLASALALRAGIVLEVSRRTHSGTPRATSPDGTSVRRRRREPPDRSVRRAQLTRQFMAEV
jgi:GAF domain-containing protein